MFDSVIANRSGGQRQARYEEQFTDSLPQDALMTNMSSDEDDESMEEEKDDDGKERQET